MGRSSASFSPPGQPDPVASQVKTTGGRSGCSGLPHCPNVPQCALYSPQSDGVSAFEPVELETASFFRALRRFQSSQGRVDKPTFAIGLNKLQLYHHQVWPVCRNRCPGCGRVRMLTMLIDTYMTRIRTHKSKYTRKGDRMLRSGPSK